MKVTTWGNTSGEAAARMDTALRGFRIRGLATNLAFLENVIAHPLFTSGECTTRFIDETPELFQFTTRKDRATRLLNFLGEVIVNGNAEMKGCAAPAGPLATPHMPDSDLTSPVPPGTRDRLKALGADGFAAWMREQPQVLLTDTTMRDAHQSLFATRMRSRDMLAVATYYSRLAPGNWCAHSRKKWACPFTSTPTTPAAFPPPARWLQLMPAWMRWTAPWTA